MMKLMIKPQVIQALELASLKQKKENLNNLKKNKWSKQVILSSSSKNESISKSQISKKLEFLNIQETLGRKAIEKSLRKQEF